MTQMTLEHWDFLLALLDHLLWAPSCHVVRTLEVSHRVKRPHDGRSDTFGHGGITWPGCEWVLQTQASLGQILLQS